MRFVCRVIIAIFYLPIWFLISLYYVIAYCIAFYQQSRGIRDKMSEEEKKRFEEDWIKKIDMGSALYVALRSNKNYQTICAIAFWVIIYLNFIR